MPFFSGANPAIIWYIQFRPRQAKSFVHLIGPCDQVHIISPGGLHDVLTVLVKSYTEVRVVPLQAMIASYHIGCYFLQRMTKMRRAIRIIDGSCDVVGLGAIILFRTTKHVSPL